MFTKHLHMHQNNYNNICLLILLVKHLILFNFIQQMCTKLADLKEWGAGRNTHNLINMLSDGFGGVPPPFPSTAQNVLNFMHFF